VTTTQETAVCNTLTPEIATVVARPCP
jgi:hypothetical protein